MRLPNLSQEADEVSSRIGYYMHPYEWSDMMKTVSKIATILVSPAATTMTDSVGTRYFFYQTNA